jgi:hypothetical protein
MISGNPLVPEVPDIATLLYPHYFFHIDKKLRFQVCKYLVGHGNSASKLTRYRLDMKVLYLAVVLGFFSSLRCIEWLSPTKAIIQ